MEPKTLLIVPVRDECNARCKFCVTKDLVKGCFGSIIQGHLNIAKLEKVIEFCKRIGVVDVNITGGGEPLLCDDECLEIAIRKASFAFGRVSMYTNAGLIKNSQDIARLKFNGITNMTISRFHHDDAANFEMMGMDYNFDSFEDLVKSVQQHGIDLKLSCLLHSQGVSTKKDIVEYIEWARKMGVKKVIFRELLDKESPFHVPVIESLKGFPGKVFHGIWGQQITDFDGIAISTYPDGSRKDTVNDGDLIFAPDSNLYSSWNTIASRIM